MMLEYQQRVVDEKAALNEKIEKLDKFIDGDIFKELSDDEQERMVRQRLCMNEYSKILSERISAYCLKELGENPKKVDLINNGRFVVSITGSSDDMGLLVRNILFNGNTMRINFYIDDAVQEFLCSFSE
jgi:tRNA pseudouridine-54 N-methylase